MWGRHYAIPFFHYIAEEQQTFIPCVILIFPTMALRSIRNTKKHCRIGIFLLKFKQAKKEILIILYGVFNSAI